MVLLVPMLNIALSFIPNSSEPLHPTPEQLLLIDASLRLIIAILSFDYSRMQVDGQGDEVGILQLPSSWSDTVCDKTLLSRLSAM